MLNLLSFLCAPSRLVDDEVTNLLVSPFSSFSCRAEVRVGLRGYQLLVIVRGAGM